MVVVDGKKYQKGEYFKWYCPNCKERTQHVEQIIGLRCKKCGLNHLWDA